MIAIFGAAKQEIQSLVRRMKVNSISVRSNFRIFEGTLMKRDVILVLTGIGEEKAATAAEYAFNNYSVNSIISTGFCGALNEKSKIGDFILYSAIKCENETANIHYSDPHLLSAAETHLTKYREHYLVGTGLTVKKVCTLPEAKRELGKRFNADAVDMESYRLAQLASNNKIPFAVVRPVFDAVFDDITILDGIMATDKIISYEGLAYIFTHPTCIRYLIDYSKRARRTGESLAEFVSKFINEI